MKITPPPGWVEAVRLLPQIGLPEREAPTEVETLELEHVEIESYVGGLVKPFPRKTP